MQGAAPVATTVVRAAPGPATMAELVEATTLAEATAVVRASHVPASIAELE